MLVRVGNEIIQGTTAAGTPQLYNIIYQGSNTARNTIHNSQQHGNTSSSTDSPQRGTKL
jgi:hypothetical protein